MHSPRWSTGISAARNVHYDARGSVVGVLDWDLAQPFDPAVDAACLAWHGWDTVRATVDELTFRRARIWWRTFGYEQLGAAVLNGEPPEIIERYVAGTIAWLAQTAEARRTETGDPDPTCPSVRPTVSRSSAFGRTVLYGAAPPQRRLAPLP
jgi:hypothetical protein